MLTTKLCNSLVVIICLLRLAAYVLDLVSVELGREVGASLFCLFSLVYVSREVRTCILFDI